MVHSGTIPVLDEIDILVVGGGPAGVAAAVTAGESGYRTLLIERYGFCGGSAVAGMSATICGLYLTKQEDDRMSKPEQIVSGFTDRFKKQLLENGGLTPPQLYGNTYVDTHEARVWKQTADKFLENANVMLLYHCSVIDVICKNGAVQGVVVSSGLGLGRIYARRIIDASGDGMVAALAGAEFACGAGGVVQNPTVIFKMSNVDTKKFWDYYGVDTICHEDFSNRLREAEKQYDIYFPRKKIWVFQGVNPTELIVNATAIHHPTEKLIMTDPEHFTYAEIMSRKQMEEYARFFVEHIPGCHASFIGETACEVGVRQTRSIKGRYTLTNEDVENCRKFEDGIVKSSWPIELHKGEVPKLHWLYEDYYEIPFRTLVPQGIENILVAGRCLSAQHEALASARVTAQCFEYGRGAAAGAILSLQSGCSVSRIDGREVREWMESL